MPSVRRLGAPAAQPSGDPAATKQQGLRAFQNGRFDEAIRLWEVLSTQDDALRAALAEAHFRRALKAPVEQRLADLRAAANLAPNEMRYQYHLGMYLHQQHDYAGAISSYRTVAERGGPKGATLLLALATVEREPLADLASLPGSTPDIRAALAPVQALLAGKGWPAPGTPASPDALRRALGIGPTEAEAVAALWAALGLIAAGRLADAPLDDPRSLPRPRLNAIRRAYRAAAAAQAGDDDTALKLLQQTYESHLVTAALLENMVAVLHERLARLLDAGDLAAAAELSQRTRGIPLGSAALDELRLQALDQAAHAAASDGEWPRAANLWATARQILSDADGLGSPRPLLHNLALAAEAQERWQEAAETWRAMLRARPRKKAGEQGDALDDARWAWVRARVIECYKRAGEPGEAVAVFRQMIKAEPKNLDLRLQLAEALLANEQEQAAFNEVQRILQIDPHFADAQMRYAELLSTRGYLPAAEEALRKAQQEHPERADVRRRLAKLLLDHAGQYVGRGYDDAAITLLDEGRQLEPENFKFPLNMARASLNLRRRDQALAYLEQVLAMAGDQLDPYLNVFQVWVVDENVEAARAVIARAEAARTLPPQFYAQAGVMAIEEVAPQPEMFNPFGPPRRTKRPQPTEEPPLAIYGRELVERAFALLPDDARFRTSIATMLFGSRPDLGLHFAEQATQLAPNDPDALIGYGLGLALNERKKDAKEQLRKAGQLARKQGNPGLAEQADGLRREIDSPLFGIAFRMRDMFAGTNLDEIDIF